MEIKKYFKNELFVGSFIIISLTFIGNFFSYLFQFLSARMLGPEDYVVVAVITSLIAIFGIPSTAIQTVISKNATALKIKKKLGNIKGLMNSSLRKMFFIALIFFILYSLVSLKLTTILNIKFIYLNKRRLYECVNSTN